MVQIDFWKNPVVSEEMTPEDKYFYLYLLTNPNTTQIGIYQITKKQMAFDLGYSIESVHSLMNRFIEHHRLIHYNPVTRELAVRDWGKDNLNKGGKPVMDCIYSELKKVEDSSLIRFVLGSIQKGEIRSLFESFCGRDKEVAHDTDKELEMIGNDDTFTHRDTNRGQKEKQKEKEKENEKQQEGFQPKAEGNRSVWNHLEEEDAKEIIELWDNNGFGFSNVNAKQQLLAWLDDSRFLQPKQVIVKAMKIACANNKRKLSYVVGILKNWQNESLLTVEEIDSYQAKSASKQKHLAEPSSGGRAIPRGFELDLTAGEDW
jgi:DnaD/phage-associated family protein